MEIGIIDNTFTRFSKLKYILEDSCEDIVRTFYEVDDVTADYESELFLVHKGNKNIGAFVKSIAPQSYILFFSGGGITKNIEGIAYSDKMFNLSDVFNEGNEEQPVKKIRQIVEIVKRNSNSINAVIEIKKILGFDETEETLTEDVFDAIYGQKDEATIEKAISRRDKYINANRER